MHRNDKLNYNQMLPNCLRNQFLVFLPTMILGKYFNIFLRIDSPLPPSSSEILKDGLGIIIGYEIVFYFGHRLLHTKPFYKKYHLLHHKTFGSVGISG